MPPPFDRSVFINCPFDEDYAPILQAIAFCVTYMGFFPRLAPENADNAVPRLERIGDLIRSSRYGIHDLSRCKVTAADEYVRMNMPFELGLDHACRRYGNEDLATKRLLVLEHARYDFQKALSDIAGWDIRAHKGDNETAVRHVRSWLIACAEAKPVGNALIMGQYLVFQEWYYERELAKGSSEEDIREYPTTELIWAMQEWMEAGQPA